MIARLRGSLAGRVGVALVLMALIASGLTAAAARWLGAGPLGLAVALAACVPLLVWLAVRAAPPRPAGQGVPAAAPSGAERKRAPPRPPPAAGPLPPPAPGPLPPAGPPPPIRPPPPLAPMRPPPAPVDATPALAGGEGGVSAAR